MSIIDIPLDERVADYANKLIFIPLKEHVDFNENTKNQFYKIIKNTLLSSKTAQSLASDFGHYTKNWNIDWRWIAHHIIHDYANIKLAKSYASFQNIVEVYKDIPKNCSQDFYTLYLSNPNNINSEPKIFKLKDLIANGSNLGKNKNEWKPVVGITDFGFRKFHPYENLQNEEIEHFYDSSFLSLKPNSHEWIENEQNYRLIESPMTERRKKIRSLIKVTITDENGNIVQKISEQLLKGENSKEIKNKSWWQKILGF